MERIFDEVGLPYAIRSDNGAPLGSTGAGGLSALSVLVAQARYRPALHPTVQPAGRWPSRAHAPYTEGWDVQAGCRDTGRAQRLFDSFRRHYNEECPHEALGQTPVAHIGNRQLVPCQRASKTLCTTPIMRSDACAGME
jgi:hypothetical protein